MHYNSAQEWKSALNELENKEQKQDIFNLTTTNKNNEAPLMSPIPETNGENDSSPLKKV